jgi:hypothetical protein
MTALMATTSTTLEQQKPSTSEGTLVISLPLLTPEATTSILQSIETEFSGDNVLIALTDAASHSLPGSDSDRKLKIISYTPTVAPIGSWTLTATDFLNAYELLRANAAKAILILGAESQSLHPSSLRALADEIMTNGSDLAVPRYSLPPRAGLVNSALLYPVSRALFGASARFPLAVDLCLSARMSERLATSAQRLTSANQADGLVWPIAEAAVAGFKIGQVEAGSRALPQPTAPDLNAVLTTVAGSMFADVDVKAAYWQRAHLAPPSKPGTSAMSGLDASQSEIQSMVDAFRIAYGNLLEIWSLVLPPQSLLGLKRLSVMPAATFVMSDSLWARTVYDFLLAYRLRTLSRSHLLGALTPLYLAWVASYLSQVEAGMNVESRIEAVATAFEADKPYLLSRWRWPDRFNP